MKYLVTGGSGYLGSHIVDELSNLGHQIYVIDNFSGNLKTKIANKASYFSHDIQVGFETIQELSSHEFDGLFHVAAKKSVNESVKNPLLYQNVNLSGTRNVVDFCMKANISKIVFTSSAAVYGNSDSTDLIKESNPLKPINPYGETKLQGEVIVASAVNSGAISAVSLRVFNIVGAKNPVYFDIKGENVLPVIMRSLSTDTSFTINGNDFDTYDGTCVRDYVNVQDVAKAHIAAMNYLHEQGTGIYKVVNVASGHGTSVLELVKIANSMANKTLRWQFGENRVGDPANVVGSNEFAYELFGWKPEKSISEGVKESIDSVLR